MATNAFLAVERIGMPEAAKILAHAALYVCCSPKSSLLFSFNYLYFHVNNQKLLNTLFISHLCQLKIMSI